MTAQACGITVTGGVMVGNDEVDPEGRTESTFLVCGYAAIDGDDDVGAPVGCGFDSFRGEPIAVLESFGDVVEAIEA